METILVPTDFSKNAEQALNYAIEIAKKENAKLIILHAFQLEYANAYVSFDIIAEEKVAAENESRKQLDIIAKKIESIGNIDFETISYEDYAVDAILNVIDEKKVELVIMGTKGATGFSGVIFGSNTAKVIKKAKCPVLAVPQKAKYKAIKNITFTTTYNFNDIKCLKKLVEFAVLFNAQITILHIGGSANEKGLKKLFAEEVSRKIPYKNIDYKVLAGKNIEPSLEKYVMGYQPNLLAMSTQRHTFFEKLFGKSVTNQMVYHTHVPLIVFHYNDKSVRNFML